MCRIARGVSAFSVGPRLTFESAVQAAMVTAQHVARLSKRMTCGMALTVPTAFVASQTVTPWLLRTLGHAWPVGSGILSSLGGVTAGAFLGLSSIAALGLAIGLMKMPYFKQTGMLGWVLTHIAAGVTLSPWYLTGVTLATSPAFIWMGGCWLSIGILLGQSPIGEKPDLMNIGRMCLLATVMGPLAWQIALGANIAQLMIYSLALASMGGCLWAAVNEVLPLLMIMIAQKNTAYLEQFIVPNQVVGEHRLPLGTEISANVYNVPQGLVLIVNRLQTEPYGGMGPSDFVEHDTQNFLILSGPPGTGKTVTALGIAHALDATLITPTTDSLSRNDLPIMSLLETNLWMFLLQAYFYQSRAKKRVVVFFDEIDSILNAPFAGFMEAFKTIACFGGKIVVVGATNQFQKIQSSILNVPELRASVAIFNLLPPNTEQLSCIWEKEIKLAVGESVKLGGLFVDSLVDPCNLREWAQRAHASGCTGRDVRAIVQSAQHSWIANKVQLRQLSPDACKAQMKKNLEDSFLTFVKNL